LKLIEHLKQTRVLKRMLQKIDDLPFVNERNAFFLLLAMHTAGVIGLSIESSRALFQFLTPFNLFATAAIILHFEKQKKSGYFIFIAVCFLLGYSVEVLGVSTGWPFGEYSYGKTLGFKLFEVPLAIGLNWVVLVYCSAHLAKRLFKNQWVAIVLGALFMTIIDLLIEPVAIAYDFWTWEKISVPTANYVGWFAVSALLHFIFQRLVKESNNSLAIRLLYIQVGFFALLNLI